MNADRFMTYLLELTTYYASGTQDGSYERLMDVLAVHCSENQWQTVLATLEQIDTWMAATDKGTEWQKSKENRKEWMR